MSRSGGGRVVLTLAALALGFVLTAGCIYTRDRTIRMRGYELSSTALDGLKVGVTTPADVEKMFGRPDRTLTPGPGRQVLVYHYDSQTQTKVSAFVVYRSASSVSHGATYRFEFKDGLLTGHTVQSTG